MNLISIKHVFITTVLCTFVAVQWEAAREHKSSTQLGQDTSVLESMHVEKVQARRADDTRRMQSKLAAGAC